LFKFIERARKRKEAKKKMMFKKIMNNMRRFVKQSERDQEKFIQRAAEAKIKGSSAQLKLAIDGLKMAVARKKKVEEMLLTFEIVLTIKESAELNKGFVDSMYTMSKDMIKIVDSENFEKVATKFEQAMDSIDYQNERTDELLDTTSTSFDNLNEDGSTISDEEIEAIINGEAGDKVGSQNAEIDKKIAEIEELLKDL
jgi:hypothetical protein